MPLLSKPRRRTCNKYLSAIAVVASASLSSAQVRSQEEPVENIERLVLQGRQQGSYGNAGQLPRAWSVWTSTRGTSVQVSKSPEQGGRTALRPLKACRPYRGRQRLRLPVPFHADFDGDYLDDGVETTLRKKVFSNTNMHCGSYRGVPKGSKGQFYGSDEATRQRQAAVHRSHLLCSTYKPLQHTRQSIEIRYAMPYNWDLETTCMMENIAATRNSSASCCAQTLISVCHNDANLCMREDFYRSAHACAHRRPDRGFGFILHSGNSFNRPYIG